MWGQLKLVMCIRVNLCDVPSIITKLILLQYNRKGKYAIIGGSGTNCLEVINLHNRYITCSYPTTGSILAITSHQERIAFGGTSSAFNIISFYDPKYQKDKYNLGESDYDYSRPPMGVITIYRDDDSMLSSVDPADIESPGPPKITEHVVFKEADEESRIIQEALEQSNIKQDTTKQSTPKQDTTKQAVSEQSNMKQDSTKPSTKQVIIK